MEVFNMFKRKKDKKRELDRKKSEEANHYEFGEEILMEEIQDGPQEEPILIPVEFEYEKKNT